MSEKCSILCVECVAGLIIYDKISSAHFFYSKPPYVQYARFMCHQINIPEWLFVAMEHTSIYPLYIGYRFTQISRYKQHLMDVEMLQLFVRRFYSLHISLSLSVTISVSMQDISSIFCWFRSFFYFHFRLSFDSIVSVMQLE